MAATIQAITGVTGSEGMGQPENVVGTGDLMLNALARSTVSEQNQLHEIANIVKGIQGAPTASALMQLQLALGDRNVEVSLQTALTRKASTALETLLRT